MLVSFKNKGMDVIKQEALKMKSFRIFKNH